VAAPIAAREIALEFSRLADEVVCVATPLQLGAVGYYYQDFHQLTDEEVIAIMRRARALPDQTAEAFEPFLVASEAESQHIRPFLLLREPALDLVTRPFIHQLGIPPIFCVSSGAMAFIITDPCISTKDTACVDVCPVDCIHPRKDEPEFEQSPMLFIHPEECIDCGACVPACPVSAIYDSPEATPESQKDLIDANAKYRAGDSAAVAEATNIVNAHVSAHPELMNIPGAERAAAHQG